MRWKTPIAWAAENDNLALVKDLLRKGAKVEMPGTESPLLQTANIEMMELLLAHGADIHARIFPGKYEGETALIHLARSDRENNHLEAIRFLLSRGVDINETDNPDKPEEGMTALMWAAHYASMETFRYLLDHGAKINLKSWHGSALMWAIEDGDFDKARLLLKRGADVNITSREEDMTPLMLEAQWGDEDFARELLRRGAKVNARDKNGKTALHYAVEEYDDSMVDFLLDWGANVNARDKDGHTPLFAAHALNKEDAQEVIQALQEAGGKE